MEPLVQEGGKWKAAWPRSFPSINSLSKIVSPGDAQRERVGAAGGELLGAAFKLLGELVTDSVAAPPENLVATLRSTPGACVEGEERPRLTITLPSKASLDQISQSLAKLLMASGSANGLPSA